MREAAQNLDMGLVHFIGIGGAGMSGIAELMHNMGYAVQGSDASFGAACARLQSLGVSVYRGHAEDNLGGAKLAVYSSAIPKSNVERQRARKKGLPLLSRAEMLAELMRLKRSIAVAGTHGKTTTTSLIAAILDGAGYDPTVINGGLINAYGANAHLGAGDWLVAEADESDGSFLRLPAQIAVVTNIDSEHLDYYKNFEAITRAFHQFVESIPVYGFAVMCHDHEETRRLARAIEDKRIITYGFSQEADVRGLELSYDDEAGTMRFLLAAKGEEVKIHLPMPGAHNVLNALAAAAVALALHIPMEVIAKALGGFSGVKRRFSLIGEWKGVRIYDDYAHHPVEIAAVLRAAADMTKGSIIALMQPHRYTRLQDYLDEFTASFSQAQSVLITPVYSAGRSP